MKRLFSKSFAAVVVVLLSIIMLTGCFNIDFRFPVSSVLGSPLVTGKWDGDTFTNEWSGFTVTLPPGFWVSDYEERIRGEYALDFLLYHYDYPEIVISLSYFDVTQGERREHSAEDYLNLSKVGLVNSPGRDFAFNEHLGSATIAEWEYVVMSGTFVNINNDPQAVFNIDRYAHRWVGTMIVIVAMYADESESIVKDFLSSIEQTW
jgi:hypothetical protein